MSDYNCYWLKHQGRSIPVPQIQVSQSAEAYWIRIEEMLESYGLDHFVASNSKYNGEIKRAERSTVSPVKVQRD